MPALVAHNAHVDMDVLTRKLTGWQPSEVFDTLRIARRLLPGRASYRLSVLTSAFYLADGLPSGLSPHRAEYDALVAARLFVKMATRVSVHSGVGCHLRFYAAVSRSPAGSGGSQGWPARAPLTASRAVCPWAVAESR
jgi:DNA polymerase III epsilon subunit-like protein